MISNIPAVSDQGQPAGAVFHRCALQVNPNHYGETFQGQQTGSDAQSHAEAVIKKAAEIGVSVLAITDHNNASGVSTFQEAAGDYNITVFPGFELSSSEGIHVLCIYPLNTNEEQLGRFLGEFGIRETEPSSAPVQQELWGYTIERPRSGRCHHCCPRH